MKSIIAILILGLIRLAQTDDFSLVIQNHQFEPSELIIPANKKIKLRIENKDSTPEEFESHELNREKLVAGKSAVTIYIGPLKAGRYPFWGEFNEKTAKGTVVAQ